MINFKQFLLEVNSTDFNGTGNTPPPTVIYPGIAIARDSPETMATGDQETTQEQFNNNMWQNWIAQHSQEMQRMGATPEQIANMLRLLRQQYFLYQSGSQGNLHHGQIYERMLQFYNKLLSKQSWYQSYWENLHRRRYVNNGIDKVNRWTLNWPFTVPGIPNIDTYPGYIPYIQ